MGLDSVALLVTVEKTFNIEIPDQEAQEIATVGDFYDVVWKHLKGRENHKCQSAWLFYKLRKFLQERYDLQRNDLKPNTRLEDVFPNKNIKAEWETVQRDLGVKFPQLALPVWLSQSILYFGLWSIIGGLILGLIVTFFLNSAFNWWLLPLSGIILTSFFWQLSQTFRTKFRVDDMRNLIYSILSLNYQQISESMGTNRQEIEKIIASLIKDATGALPSEITRDAHIVYDLGLD